MNTLLRKNTVKPLAILPEIVRGNQFQDKPICAVLCVPYDLFQSLDVGVKE
jgi:hypothetical protein